jgi:arabinogalactan endo-1,4-beta-galactosidase
MRNLVLLFCLVFFCGGKQKDSGKGETIQFAKGADISWVTQMESAGIKFFDASGRKQECTALMKSHGFNSIRLRVWVNLSGGWNNKADVVAKAERAHKLGMRIMIDFHYSDNWADPGKQTLPAAWTSYSFSQLQQSVFNHTVEVLQALKSKGISPEWVQVGNETNDGMLWPSGKASVNMAAFASLVKSGYDAVKAVNSASKVIVHISNGYDNNLFRWIFDGLQSNDAKWDIIGMSLYPETSNWQLLNTQCLLNMNDMIERYKTPVMICEVGMFWDEAAVCKSFLRDLVVKVKSLPSNKGLGVFYWEPQCYNNWEEYLKGAFDNTGKATEALDAFR